VLALQQALVGLNINFTSHISQQGHRIFADFTFPDAKIVLTQVGEEFATGVRLINSYDKSTGLIIVPRLCRLVCTNGMVLKTFGEGLVMKHNNHNLAQDIAGMVEATLAKIINSQANLQAMVSNCMADSIEWHMVEGIMKRLIGRQKHMVAIMSRCEPVNGVITRWALYNAITAYATHGEQIKPNIEAWLQSKAEKVLNTPLAGLADVEVPAMPEVQ
jgi:hypothetical protein